MIESPNHHSRRGILRNIRTSLRSPKPTDTNKDKTQAKKPPHKKKSTPQLPVVEASSLNMEDVTCVLDQLQDDRLLFKAPDDMVIVPESLRTDINKVREFLQQDPIEEAERLRRLDTD
ncbi:hypothetical protein AWENTII_004314 [Aspergillus wentii]|nr:hypothetical protein MW887_010750 [Aspergillus wentii]